MTQKFHECSRASANVTYKLRFTLSLHDTGQEPASTYAAKRINNHGSFVWRSWAAIRPLHLLRSFCQRQDWQLTKGCCSCMDIAQLLARPLKWKLVLSLCPIPFSPQSAGKPPMRFSGLFNISRSTGSPACVLWCIDRFQWRRERERERGDFSEMNPSDGGREWRQSSLIIPVANGDHALMIRPLGTLKDHEWRDFFLKITDARTRSKEEERERKMDCYEVDQTRLDNWQTAIRARIVRAGIFHEKCWIIWHQIMRARLMTKQKAPMEHRGLDSVPNENKEVRRGRMTTVDAPRRS